MLALYGRLDFFSFLVSSLWLSACSKRSLGISFVFVYFLHLLFSDLCVSNATQTWLFNKSVATLKGREVSWWQRNFACTLQSANFMVTFVLYWQGFNIMANLIESCAPFARSVVR